MGWSYGSDQAIFEKPLFSVRLAEVAIFYLEISTSKTTDLQITGSIDPLGMCLCPWKSAEFMPKKKVGSHVQKSK